MKTVLFDLDGTLISSHEDVWDCLDAALRPFQPSLPPAMRADNRLLAKTGAELLRMVYPEATLAECEGYVQRVHALYTQQCPLEKTYLYPGVADLLQSLNAAGYRMLIVTMKAEESARRILQVKGIRTFFDGVFSPDSFPPDRLTKTEIFQRLKDTYHLSAENCITIGDSVSDVTAAHAAGLPAVAVTWGYTGAELLAECGAEAVAATVSDCARLIGE